MAATTAESLAATNEDANTVANDAALNSGAKEVRMLFQATEHIIKYWTRRFNDPNWRGNSRRAGKWRKYSEAEIFKLLKFLKVLCDTSPRLPYQRYVDFAKEYTGLDITTSAVRLIIQETGHSYVLCKQPFELIYPSFSGDLTLPGSWKSISTRKMKFSTENLYKYVRFLNWIGRQDPQKLRFIDKCRFAPKGASTES